MSLNNLKSFIKIKTPVIYVLCKNAMRVPGHLKSTKNEIISKYFPENYYGNKAWNDLKILNEGIKRLNSTNSDINPGNVVIEINNTCNLNCPMCSTQLAKRKKGEMSTDLFEHIIKEISKINKSRNLVLHTVGEPFFYSNLPEIFKICKKHGFTIHFTTNGLLLHKYMGLINEFPGIISDISFSIDGATKETYEKLRKGGKFEPLLSNLDLIHNYNLKAKINEKIPISLQAAISDENFDEIPLFFKVYKKYFTQDKMLFGLVNNLSATHAQGTFYKSRKINLDKLERRSIPCTMLWTQTHILFNGDISVCCRDYNGELILGNILEKSISDVWTGDIYKNYREMHLKKDVEKMPLCKDCYGVGKDVSSLFNNYIHFLFKKFPDREDGFYIKNIKKSLDYLNEHYDVNSLKHENISIFNQEIR